MQEEVTQKTIALSVKTARVTADVLKNMLRKYLSGQKQKGSEYHNIPVLHILKFRLEHSARHSTELMQMWLWS